MIKELVAPKFETNYFRCIGNKNNTGKSTEIFKQEALKTQVSGNNFQVIIAIIYYFI